ncbi:GNAT family N-acetyltransferase [Mechercharimyces sp. CAU 1602]|uniref:GNAT family N-acetyltransferase n=1 Tax=Mechercharimyces sp. CAU 1602 TaxID=2973933 RepID=UPI0021616A93|nr:GNAT family N-acetyltransferase [Mechercharimyces sp. CAU 1602]MCS1350242.1 GNAT family N-acetyltransferase [Mechercharimyces sp. CAU 1602]
MKRFQSYLRSFSTLLGYLVGVLMYVAYAYPNQDWFNAGLVSVSLFVAIFLPYYSRISNKIDEWLCFKTAFVTPGRVGRFAAQWVFNLVVFYVFLASGVITVANADALGGVLGISLLTTAASQGIQYVAITLANREIGNVNRNVAWGLAFNILVTAAAALGIGWMRPVFIFSGLLFGALVFGIGMLSDLRSVIPRKGGIGIFFGTFNPFHNTHLAIVKQAMEERGLEKVIIHSTVVPKLHADALAKGEIVIAERQQGMRVYGRTSKADVHVNYFPTGNRFYEFDTRKQMMEWAVAEAGLQDKIEVLAYEDTYLHHGFYGIIRKIKEHNPGKRLHGIHGSDLGGMWVRRIYDESGWIYPYAVRRVDKVSATAIRNGAEGMAPRVIEDILRSFRESAATVQVNNHTYRLSEGLLQEEEPLTPSGSIQSSSLSSEEDELIIKVVENEEEKQKAFMIRAIVYMHEQHCPYEEEFDLNDYSATQVIGLLGEEPVLTARIRYLPEVAKFERLSIRPEYRGRGYGHQLFRFLLQFSRKKGYNRFYLHAQSRLASFYEGYGFRVVGDTFAFSDHEYVEMVADVSDLTHISNDVDLTSHIGIEPMHLNRPEGRLHEPGPLEESMERMLREQGDKKKKKEKV